PGRRAGRGRKTRWIAAATSRPRAIVPARGNACAGSRRIRGIARIGGSDAPRRGFAGRHRHRRCARAARLPGKKGDARGHRPMANGDKAPSTDSAIRGDAKQKWEEARRDGWRRPLARATTGVLAFLTLTGLTIFGLPFSLFNQHAVLVHTAVGLIFLLPLTWYLVSHVVAYWDFPLTHVKFTGWASGAMALVCSASGVVLAYEAWFGRRITYSWRTIHVATTFGLVAFLA